MCLDCSGSHPVRLGLSMESEAHTSFAVRRSIHCNTALQERHVLLDEHRQTI